MEIDELQSKIKKLIRIEPNFPKEGVNFIDTTPLLRDQDTFNSVIKNIAAYYKESSIDFIVGKDMQSLIWTGAIAHALGVGIVPMFRKDLVGELLSAEFQYEYDTRKIHLQKESIQPGQKVLLVDYILATGETMRTMAQLVEKLQGEIVGIFCLVELADLKGRRGLENYPFYSLITY